MALHVYRYTWQGIDAAQINGSIVSVPPATSTPATPPVYVDVTADDSALGDLNATMASLNWAYDSTDPPLPPPLAPDSTCIWRPGLPSGGPYLETWDEVASLMAAVQGYLTVVVDDSIAPAVIPAAADTDFFGRGALQSSRYLAPIATRTSILIADGGRLRNVARLSNVELHGAPTVRPFLFGDIAELVMSIANNARVRLDVGATFPAIEFVGASADLALTGGGSLANDVPAGVPVVSIPTPGSLLIFSLVTSPNEGLPTVEDRTFGGDATATVYCTYDATTHLEQPQTLFPGTLLTQRLDSAENVEPSAGDTASRPAAVYLRPGQTYFDTTLAIPIWWTGAAWVNSIGLPV